MASEVEGRKLLYIKRAAKQVMYTPVKLDIQVISILSIMKALQIKFESPNKRHWDIFYICQILQGYKHLTTVGDAIETFLAIFSQYSNFY